MKQGLSIFTRFLAIFVVIFWGISVAIPQKTQKDDDFKFPLWTDIDIEADADTPDKTAHSHDPAPLQSHPPAGSKDFPMPASNCFGPSKWAPADG